MVKWKMNWNNCNEIYLIINLHFRDKNISYIMNIHIECEINQDILLDFEIVT